MSQTFKTLPMCQRMAALRDSFPTLRGRFESDQFDAQEIEDFVLSPAATTGSTHAARFLLSVWSGAAPLRWTDPEREGAPEEGPKIVLDDYRWPWKTLPFDLHAAMQGWDDPHRAAFAAWARSPFWP